MRCRLPRSHLELEPYWWSYCVLKVKEKMVL
jgi:hypothetical protein